MRPKLKCILVIDDDEPTNFFSQMILEDLNCDEHIKTVQSGQEALEYLGKSEMPGADRDHYPSPDLVFLDINMPAMNGWEFLEEYKKMTVKHRIIMVMLTTSLFPEDRSRAEAMPEISGFENKPLTVEKVESVLDKYFQDVAAQS
jgi:CheY-like chemotaxis protein